MRRYSEVSVIVLLVCLFVCLCDVNRALSYFPLALAGFLV